MNKHLACKNGTEPRHYIKEGVNKGVVEQWEDGMRTDGSGMSYEWWYFDSNLNDGANLVIVFMSKNVFNPQGPLQPSVTFELKTPDGLSHSYKAAFSGEDFCASKEKCNVAIGPCTFEGNLHTYHIHVEKDDLNADIELIGNVPAWRHENGFAYFGDQEEHYFAWLPAVPEGSVKAKITIDGTTTEYTGTGYHDHNWGNMHMAKLMHHWYWGRANIGKYRVISSYVTAEKDYGYTELPNFFLIDEGKIVSGDRNSIKLITDEPYIDEYSGKPVHRMLRYELQKDNLQYNVIYKRKKDILNYKMLDALKGEAKIMAEKIGFDGAYIRFIGEISIEKMENGKIVDTVTDPSGIWELMYFGRTPEEN